MRTQIALEPDQHAAVKQKAAQLGITMAEYIRRLVDRDLVSTTPSADPSSIIGLGHSGGGDVAAEKDRLVSAAIARHRR